jgi:hypothetical protein
MITVNCSQCKAALEMDDAFAGGVCRCHYCGTIQTVPAQAKRVPVSAGAPASTRTQQVDAPGAAAKEASGLDALAHVVANSGLSGAGMRSPAQPQAAAPAAPTPVDYAMPSRQKTLNTPMIVALGVIALLLIMVGWLMFGTTTTTVVTPAPRPSPGPGVTPAPPGGNGHIPAPQPDGEPEAVAAGPNFCGIDLTGVPSVVYVLDRGGATAALFDALKEATYRSVESLKPGRKFQIIFWDNGSTTAAYPADGLADASPQEVEAARKQFADLVAFGSTSAGDALRRAAAERPGAIVLVTPKAIELDEDLPNQVHALLRGRSTKVHTVALGGDDGNPVLKSIADKTRGEFRVVTEKDLRR